MPELPEIIIIRDDLKKVLPGKKIVDVAAKKGYPLEPSNAHFDDFVVNRTIIDVINIAKLLVIRLSSGHYICAHLRMTGNILYNTKDKYTKITLLLDDGSELYYSTVRKLGYFEIWDQEKLDTYAQKIGKTLLESDLEPQEFISLLQRKKTYIRNALLDQSLISGIGNIYANDALYLSKIHPRSKPGDISKEQLEKLFFNLQSLMLEGIKNRGISMDRYKDVYGILGTQQDHFIVYGKEGNICTHCHSSEIKFEKIQGRGAYFCPECQVMI